MIPTMSPLGTVTPAQHKKLQRKQKTFEHVLKASILGDAQALTEKRSLSKLDRRILAGVLKKRQAHLLLSEPEREQITKFCDGSRQLKKRKSSYANQLISLAAAELAVKTSLQHTRQPYHALGQIIMLGYAQGAVIPRIYAFIHNRQEGDNWLAKVTLTPFITAVVLFNLSTFASNLIYSSHSGEFSAKYFPQLRPLLQRCLPTYLLPQARSLQSQAESSPLTVLLSLVAAAFIAQGVATTVCLSADQLFDPSNPFYRFIYLPYLAASSFLGEFLVDFGTSLMIFDGNTRRNFFNMYYLNKLSFHLTFALFIALNLIGTGSFTIPPFVLATRKNQGEISITGLLSTLLAFGGGLGICVVGAVIGNYNFHGLINGAGRMSQQWLLRCCVEGDNAFVNLGDVESPAIMLQRQFQLEKDAYAFLQSLYHDNTLRYVCLPIFIFVLGVLPNAYSLGMFTEDMFADFDLPKSISLILFIGITFYSVSGCSAFMNVEQFTKTQVQGQVNLLKGLGLFNADETTQPHNAPSEIQIIEMHQRGAGQQHEPPDAQETPRAPSVAHGI